MTQKNMMQTRTPSRSGSGKPAFRGSSGPSRGNSSGGSTFKRTSSRPSFGGGSSSGRRFGGGGGRSSGGRRNGGGGGGRGRGERIDFAKFIRPAERQEEVVYTPKNQFTDFGFDKTLLVNMKKKGFSAPMPIQDATINFVLEGRDVFGLANTGTGKTAAFALPLIQKALKDKNEKVLILAPTRELALQIEQEIYDLTHGLFIFTGVAVGGLPVGRQLRAIEKGVSFLVGTPGRVMDFIERKAVRMSEWNAIVLDEADRMLDMGFRDDMERIMRAMPEDHQTLFFSATLSPEIKKLSEKFLRDPEHVSVKLRDTSKNIDQNIVEVKDKEHALDSLHDILIGEGSEKVLIFREMKHSVDTLAKELKARGFKVGAIHGDKNNRDRLRTLEEFKAHKIQALIATDVAARGLDIPNVTHVINYDVPQTYDTYVHRIGRTGRGSKTGKALTFVPKRGR